MPRMRGDTNLQLKYAPRKSKKDDCTHRLTPMQTPVRSSHYWFQMCVKCGEVVWNA